jgi:hypothetical protein
MKALKKILRGLLIIFLIFFGLIFGYYIYLHIPYTNYVIKSPYGNASIQEIIEERQILGAFNNGGSDSHIEIMHNGNEIGRVKSNCWECLKHNIIDIKWYIDSVNVTYETSYEGRDTLEVVYSFEKPKD